MTDTAARLAQIRDRSERLAAIPMETAAEHRVMRDMIDSIGDVRWLLERVEQLERESFAAALDTGPGAWCWNRHPDHPLPCGRFAGHDGQHARGEHRWDNPQQPAGGDRG